MNPNNLRNLISYILILFCCLHSGKTNSQESHNLPVISKNTIYMELFGNAGFYSINYDRILYTKKLVHINGRVGFSYIPKLGVDYSSFNRNFIYPIEIDCSYGRKHQLEMGFGVTQVIKVYDDDILKVFDNYIFYGFHVGYRYQRLEGGFFFKGGINPYIHIPKYLNEYDMGGGGFAYFVLGFGYTF